MKSTIENSLGFARFFFNLLVTILLGIVIGNVTLLGFAFERKLAFYFLIGFWSLLVSCIIFRLLRKWIVFFLIKSINNVNDTFGQFMFIFLRSKNTSLVKKQVEKILKGKNSIKKINKKLNKLANGRIIPFYFGTYPALFYSSLAHLALFFISIYLWKWKVF